MSSPYTKTKRGTVDVTLRPSWWDGKDIGATVPAYLAGSYLALHRPVRAKKGDPDTFVFSVHSWVITHVPSGWAVISAYRCPRTFAAARRLLLALANDPKLDFDCTAKHIMAWPKARGQHVYRMSLAACDEVRP